MERNPNAISKKGLKTTLVGIIISAFLAIIKGLGGIFGHSYALIADAIESASDVLTSAMLWAGLKWSSKPPDENHPYGHGKIEALVAIGIAIALIDPYAQGMSSSSTSRIAATTQGYGMFALVDYAYQGNFPFVDVDKIGSTGHSMGGNAAIRGADYFGKEAIRNEQASKLHSVYVSGYVLTLRDEILKDSRSNMGISYALYDEGAFRNELKGWDAGNMEIAPESLRAVSYTHLTLPTN